MPQTGGAGCNGGGNSPTNAATNSPPNAVGSKTEDAGPAGAGFGPPPAPEKAQKARQLW
ncbi:hypothetical protein JCM17207_11800 [Faecalibacterium gallinarum]|uniref:Uncharacterized protein n=1 Tax=Faecalibacterium gallinarum TaxID=2903556 RepID=A0AA37IYI3_9FIRM|nr:hypothetical protein JCM17207_11800 [Faecalibacterium gallinarum]